VLYAAGMIPVCVIKLQTAKRLLADRSEATRCCWRARGPSPRGMPSFRPGSGPVTRGSGVDEGEGAPPFASKEVAEALEYKCASASDINPRKCGGPKWIKDPIDQAIDGSDP
jgi:hypothetical protein